MRLLLLGGTAFLGRALAQEALGDGHDVTVLARGQSGRPPEGVTWVRADREAPGTFETLRDAAFDAVVDLARQPGQVRRAVAALAERVPHYVFVSTGNVYADTTVRDTDESAPLHEPLDGETMPDMSAYGPAKVACEQAVRHAYGDRCTIARAGLIGGPGDTSGRSGYWPWRLAHPSNDAGEVLVPDAPDWPVEIVDVRDLAAWLVGCAAAGRGGVFNAAGPTITLREALETAAHAAGARPAWRAASADFLTEHEVAAWMGPRSLPLWVDDPAFAGFCDRDNGAAVRAGLVFRPYAELFRDALAWEETGRPADQPRQAGLSDAEERALLATLPARPEGPL